MTKIEWTEHTWNPIVGCSIVSPGCTNCYAMKMAARIEAMGSGRHYAGLTKRVNGNAVWTGKLAQAPEHILFEPLRRKKPTMYFVNSMSDLFHEDVPIAWIDQVLAVMADCPQHTFQVLTKRTRRMRQYFERLPERIREMDCHSALDWIHLPLPNLWLGSSAEDQTRYEERRKDLAATPAEVRFWSLEPLLGPIGLGAGVRAAQWVIVGGESGPDARPMHPDWVRAIRDQCQAAGVAFFFKQWGAWSEWHEFESEAAESLELQGSYEHFPAPKGESGHPINDGVHMRRVGKKAAGRLLDGREWNEMPISKAGVAQ